MLVAILALVVAMSGSAVAVSAARHSGDKLISKRSLSGNRLRHNTVTGKEVSEKKLGQVPRAGLATHVPPLVWHPLTLINGWYNWYVTKRVPAYAIDVQGIVHLRGFIMGVSNGALYQFAVLPPEARPDVKISMPTTLFGGSGDGAVTVQSDGTMSSFRTDIHDPPGDQTSLDGLTYARR